MQSASSFDKLVHKWSEWRHWRKIHKYGGSALMTCIGVQPLRQTTFNFSEGRCLPRLALHRYTFKLTPLPPDLFDCYGCLRKIRRRHYHINRATGTRRTGNLSSPSSMEARRNRTSDTFGVTSEGQWKTVNLRVGIFDGYDEGSITTSRRGTAALRHTIKLTIETSLDTIMKGSTTNRNWSTLSPAMEITHICKCGGEETMHM